MERLRSNQSNSEKPGLFERDVEEAFRLLGFEVEHKGGPNDCDVIVYHHDNVAIVDTKTTSGQVINEGYVNFEALDRYKAPYKAQDVAVVAKGFAGGNIRQTAAKRQVVLIETEALCKVLENQAIYPYNLDDLYENVFRKRTVVTNNDIEPSTEPIARLISILKRLFEAFEADVAITVHNLHIYFRFLRLDFSDDEISDALDFLCAPPFSILHKEEETYHLLLPFDEIRGKLGIIWSAITGQVPPPPPDRPQVGRSTTSTGLRQVTAGDFVFEGEYGRTGIFAYKENRQVKIDVGRSSRDVQATLSQYSLSVTNIGSFYYQLRSTAGLLQSRG